MSDKLDYSPMRMDSKNEYDDSQPRYKIDYSMEHKLSQKTEKTTDSTVPATNTIHRNTE
jgi:hypothetical protein